MPYIGVSPQFGVRRKHTYIVSGSSTDTFSGAGAEGATLSYTDSNFVDVYQNGVKLGDDDYTSTSGTSIVLGTTASDGDIVEIIVFDAFSISDTVSKSDGGTFDGNVTMAGTLGVTGTQTNNGNLVISKATPNVDIKDTGTAQASMDFLSNSDTVRATIGMERSAGGGLFVGSSAYSAVFGTASSGNTELATNNNIRMVIDGSGLVGIGTTSPSSFNGGANNLVVGTGSGSEGITVFAANDSNSAIFFADGDSTTTGQINYQHSDDAFTFHTNGGTERMRIRSGGFVAINTTGGSAQFQVLASSGEIVYFQNSAGTGAKLTAGNQSFSAVSDENKKENIVELDKQQSYDNIKNIRAVTYKFKDMEVTDDNGKKTTHKDDKSRIGFIAQDWEPKYSQLVNTDDEGVKSLLYTETTPVLLSALQKAQEKIEELEARIKALEGK